MENMFLKHTNLPAGAAGDQMFAKGEILVVVKHIDRYQLSLGIRAPNTLRIDRVERLTRHDMD
jgi:sRNA-binding carbon storage regulator CsrA